MNRRLEALRFINHGVYGQQPREERVLSKGKAVSRVIH